MALRPRHALAALAGTLAALALGLTSGVGGVSGVATACAQTPPEPTIPTVGPIDPTCGAVPDTDRDGVLDYQDNCNGYYNPTQLDTDQDSGEPPYEPVRTGYMDRDPKTGGDACDTDDDADGVADAPDNCQKVPNPDQRDADGDGLGDRCDDETTAPPAAAAAPAGSASASPGPGAGADGPRVTLLPLARTLHVAQMRAGIAVPVRCSTACRLTAELARAKKPARRLATATATLDDAGTTFVFVRLKRSALRSIARARRVEAKLRLTATDAQGGHRTGARRRLTLRR